MQCILAAAAVAASLFALVPAVSAAPIGSGLATSIDVVASKDGTENVDFRRHGRRWLDCHWVHGRHGHRGHRVCVWRYGHR